MKLRQKLFADVSDHSVCNINNSNSNSHDNVYGAVSIIAAVHCHCESSPGLSDECSTQLQVAADLWSKPISLRQ